MLQVGRPLHNQKEFVAKLIEQGMWMDAIELLQIIMMARKAAEDAMFKEAL